MMNFLEQFEEGLEKEKMAGQLRLLDFACATKARARTVTLTKPSRDEILHFSILGGYERGFGVFISKVSIFTILCDQKFTETCFDSNAILYYSNFKTSS